VPAITAIFLPSSRSGSTSPIGLSTRATKRAGRAVIGIAEIGAAARFRGGGDRGDHGVAAIVVERIEQRVERARLDGAG
jgi:hypothetical protein